MLDFIQEIVVKLEQSLSKKNSFIFHCNYRDALYHHMSRRMDIVHDQCVHIDQVSNPMDILKHVEMIDIDQKQEINTYRRTS
jgi:hypothetical protein